MKYLKTFEELSPETYKSAADKLVARGETERAQNITQYIESEYFKNFIDKMRTDPSFKKLVEDLKRHPEMSKIIKSINPKSTIEEINNLIENREELTHSLEQEEQVLFSDFSEQEKKARIVRALKRFGIGTILATGLAIALIATGNADMAGISHEIQNMSQLVDSSLACFITAFISNAAFQTGMALAPRVKSEEPLSEED